MVANAISCNNDDKVNYAKILCKVAQLRKSSYAELLICVDADLRSCVTMYAMPKITQSLDNG